MACRLLNRRLRASAIGPDHLLASGTKDQAVGPLSRARRVTRSTIAFLRLDLIKFDLLIKFDQIFDQI